MTLLLSILLMLVILSGVTIFCLALHWIVRKVQSENIPIERNWNTQQIIENSQARLDSVKTQDKKEQSIMKVLTPYCLLGFLMAFIPEQIAVNVPVISIVAETLGTLLPAILTLPQLSPYPATMQLYMTVMWLLMPWFVIKTAFLWGRPVAARTNFKLLMICILGLLLPALFTWLLGFETITADRFNAMSSGRGKGMVYLYTQFKVGTALIGTSLFCITVIVWSLELKALYFLGFESFKKIKN